MLYVVLTNYNIQSSTVSHPLATWCVYNAAAAAAAAAVLMWFCCDGGAAVIKSNSDVA